MLHEGWATLVDKQSAINLLDRLLFGVALVSAAGQVVMMNQQARRILSSTDGIALVGCALTPARAFERSLLSRALGRKATGLRSAGGAFIVGRPSGRMPYAVLVIPMPEQAHTARDPERPVATVLITDFDARAEIQAELLSNLYGFTSTESKLALAVAQGRNLREVAVDSGRSLSTLRSQLSAIFEKTGIKRQVDIVRLVLSLPALRL